MVRRLYLISALILLVGSDLYSQTARVTKLQSPQPVAIAGYVRGHCVSVDRHTRLCKMLSEDKDTFLLEREGKPVGTWPGNSYLGETSDFEVLRGDLDGDRRPELIVANHDSTSAGMGVSQWTIFIFPNVELRNFDPPLSFGVEEYGAFGTFVAANRGVNILTTRWMWWNTKETRGGALYLVGQWWRYKAGELYPMVNRPIMARRYLLSFEQERLRTLDSAQVPYRWFANPRTERLDVDPIVALKQAREKRGIIESVSVHKFDSDRAVKIIFKHDSESRNTYVYAYDDVDEGEVELRFFGDAATRRIYPERYLPARPEGWLKGRRGALSINHDGSRHSDVFEILWLEPNSRKP